MKTCTRFALAASFALMTPSVSAAAGLDGSQVTVTGYCCTGPVAADRFTVPQTATVGPGIEFPSGSLVPTTRSLIKSNIDVSELAIDLQYTDTSPAAIAPFNGYAFDFSGLGGNRIAEVSLNPLSTYPPDSVGLSFDSDSVFYNGSGLTFTPSSRVRIDVVLAPVPEPTTTLLFMAGISLLALRVHRKSRLGRR